MAKVAMGQLGLIGHPLDHSRSPAMQQAALDALGIPARYTLWDTAPHALAARVATLRSPGMLGANVTIPYKTDVLPLLDHVTPQALRQAGAVNTIVREETAGGVRLVGHNTDVQALARVLDEHNAWTRRAASARCRVLVLGAGGAAHAALGVAQLRGAEVSVAARNPSHARTALARLWRRSRADQADGDEPVPDAWLARALDLRDRDALAAALPHVDVLINATPIGTRDPEATPIPLDLVRALPVGAFVLDMVYNPPQTALVCGARAAGLRATGGLAMLLYQGAAAFTLWTQREAPLAVMRTALRASLEDAAVPLRESR